MNDSDLKKLRALIKEEIRPVKEIVEIIKKKVDNQELHIHVTTENVRSVKEQQSVINEKLDSHSASLVSIESKLDSYADSYKINRHNIERVDTRLSAVEDELNIEVPEDLKVPHFADQPH